MSVEGLPRSQTLIGMFVGRTARPSERLDRGRKGPIEGFCRLSHAPLRISRLSRVTSRVGKRRRVETS